MNAAVGFTKKTCNSWISWRTGTVPVGCPSTKIPWDYRTQDFLPPSLCWQQGCECWTGTTANLLSWQEHVPQDSQIHKRTSVHNKTLNAPWKKKLYKPLLSTGRCECSFDHRKNVINTHVPNSENPSDLVLMRGIHPELLTGPTVSAGKYVPYSESNSKVKKTAGQQQK